MRRFRLVVVDSTYLGDNSFFKHETAVVNELGGEIVFADFKTEDDIANGIGDADIVLCCGNPPITKKVLERMSGDLVIRYGIGVNSIDLKSATDNNKIIYNSPGFCKEELVMHASALILACIRNIGYYNNEVKLGNWPKGKGPVPRRLSNLTVGLFGFGSSARPMVDVFGNGFQSKIIAYDPYIDLSEAEKLGVKPVNFDTLLEESDIISIHAPLNESTYHIFDERAFKKMKNTSMIVNVSRGGLICEKDLINALISNEISYAGLDVFETEPIERDNPLLKMQNVVLTPHSGFYGLEAVENSHIIVSDLIRNYVNKRILMKNIVNKDIIPKLLEYKLIDE